MIDRGVRALKFLYGVTGAVGLVAGIATFMFPLESVDLPIIFSGIAFAVLGGMLLARAFTFGRSAR